MFPERRAAMTMMTTQWTTKTLATPVAAAAVATTEPIRPTDVCPKLYINMTCFYINLFVLFYFIELK
jgi:hypothetical protein